MAKIYKYNGNEYIRKQTACNCLGCDFLDEETGDCLAPMPEEIGGDCMEIVNDEPLEYKHYQWIEKFKSNKQ